MKIEICIILTAALLCTAGNITGLAKMAMTKMGDSIVPLYFYFYKVLEKGSFLKFALTAGVIFLASVILLIFLICHTLTASWTMEAAVAAALISLAITITNIIITKKVNGRLLLFTQTKQ